MMDKKPHIKPYIYGMLAGFGAISLSILFFFFIYRFDGFGDAVSTMTGIKYRTRAMMGGCQGGFCQMKIEHFIEQELGTEPENVRYSRQGSWVLTGNMRKEEN